MPNEMKDLEGKIVKRIFISEKYLKFETDQGIIFYRVSGECCSFSYFYNFEGVKRLLSGNPILKVESVAMDDIGETSRADLVQWYGFRFITEDKEFGEVSSVMSFRNESNGYYGGDIEKCEIVDDVELEEITEDWTTNDLGN